jgi:hypothetical protein
MVRVSEKFLQQITLLAKDGYGQVDAFGSVLKNAAYPVDPDDLATKQYVDNNSGGGGDGYGLRYTAGPVSSGAEFTSIQAAVDQALADGASTAVPATIYCANGTFVENVTITGGGISLVGVDLGTYVAGTITFTAFASAFYSITGFDCNALAITGASTGFTMQIAQCRPFALTCDALGANLLVFESSLGTLSGSLNITAMSTGYFQGCRFSQLFANDVSSTISFGVSSASFLYLIGCIFDRLIINRAVAGTAAAAVVISNCNFLRRGNTPPLEINGLVGASEWYLLGNNFSRVTGTSGPAVAINGLCNLRFGGGNSVGPLGFTKPFYTTSGGATVTEGQLLESVLSENVENTSLVPGDTVDDALEYLDGYRMKYTVGPAGSGAEFTTIQAAVDQAVVDGIEPYLISLFPGEYNEDATITGSCHLEGNGSAVFGNITLDGYTATSLIWYQFVINNFTQIRLTITGPEINYVKITNIEGQVVQIDAENSFIYFSDCFIFPSGGSTGTINASCRLFSLNRCNVNGQLNINKTNTAGTSEFQTCHIRSDGNRPAIIFTSAVHAHTVVFAGCTFRNGPNVESTFPLIVVDGPISCRSIGNTLQSSWQKPYFSLLNGASITQSGKIVEAITSTDVDNLSAIQVTNVTQALDYLDGYKGIKYTVGPENSGAQFATITEALAAATADGAGQSMDNQALIIIHPGVYEEGNVDINVNLNYVSFFGLASGSGREINHFTNMIGTVFVNLNINPTGSYDVGFSNLWIQNQININSSTYNGRTFFYHCRVNHIERTGSVAPALHQTNLDISDSSIRGIVGEFFRVSLKHSVVDYQGFDINIGIRSSFSIINCVVLENNPGSGVFNITKVALGETQCYFVNNYVELRSKSMNIDAGVFPQNLTFCNNTFFRKISAGNVVSFSGTNVVILTGNRAIGEVTKPYYTNSGGVIGEGDFLEQVVSDQIENQSSVVGNTITDALNNLSISGGSDWSSTLFAGNITDGYNPRISEGDEIQFETDTGLGINLLGNNGFSIYHSETPSATGGSVNIFGQSVTGAFTGGNVNLSSGSGNVLGEITLGIGGSTSSDIAVLLNENTLSTKQDGYVLAWNAAGYNEYVEVASGGGSQTLNEVLAEGNATGGINQIISYTDRLVFNTQSFSLEQYSSNNDFYIIYNGAATAGAGGIVSISAQDSDGVQAGGIELYGGYGDNSTGGPIGLYAGQGNDGGNIVIYGGDASSTTPNNGGLVEIKGGDSLVAAGGNVEIKGGNSGGTDLGGSVFISTGSTTHSEDGVISLLVGGNNPLTDLAMNLTQETVTSQQDGYVLAWNVAGYNYYTPMTGGGSVSFEQENVNVTVDGQTSFILSQTPVSENSVMMFLNGVKVNKAEISLSGNTITYSGIGVVTTDDVEFYYAHG